MIEFLRLVDVRAKQRKEEKRRNKSIVAVNNSLCIYSSFPKCFDIINSFFIDILLKDKVNYEEVRYNFLDFYFSDSN
jgi:hypothetical protein